MSFLILADLMKLLHRYIVWLALSTIVMDVRCPFFFEPLEVVLEIACILEVTLALLRCFLEECLIML